jgi:hypothetical protein
MPFRKIRSLNASLHLVILPPQSGRNQRDDRIRCEVRDVFEGHGEDAVEQFVSVDG